MIFTNGARVLWNVFEFCETLLWSQSEVWFDRTSVHAKNTLPTCIILWRNGIEWMIVLPCFSYQILPSMLMYSSCLFYWIFLVLLTSEHLRQKCPFHLEYFSTAHRSQRSLERLPVHPQFPVGKEPKIVFFSGRYIRDEHDKNEAVLLNKFPQLALLAP